MRAAMGVAIFAILLVGMGVVAVGQASSLCAFTPPRNEAAQLTVNGEFHRFNDRFTDDRNNASSGSLALEGFAWSQGPGLSYNVKGSSRVRLASEGVSLGSSLNSDAQLRRYLDDLPFAFGGINTHGAPFLQPLAVSATAGGGIGRFVNVTPMAQALKISRLLEARGVLDEAPSAETIGELAQIIGRRPEIGLSGVLQEIEDLLGRTLDVSTVLALQDLLRAEVPRFCGWEVSLGLGYEIFDPTGPSDAVLVSRADYALALDPDSQLLAGASGQAPLPFTGAHQVNASLGYDRVLSPTAELAADLGYTRKESAAGTVSETGTLDLALSLEVHPPLSVALKGHFGVGTGFEELEWGFDVALTYQVF